MNIRTILAPVDYTTCSLIVTQNAASLAVKLGARLVLLHVAELPRGVSPRASLHPGGGDISAREYLYDDAYRHLARFVDAARDLGAEVDVTVEVGPVVPTILAVSAARKADLLVMSTHGRAGVARALLGSVAEAVAHKSPVPVMLVRREPRAECGVENCDGCTKDGRSAVETQVSAEADG
jgi:universal stress protein A